MEDDAFRRKVFNYICGKGGCIPFPELLKHPSPLAKKKAGEIVSWLKNQVEENNVFFLQYKHGGPDHIEFVRLRWKIRFCLSYLRSRTCKFGDGCRHLHICKAFVEGSCKDSTKCGLSHSFHDSANLGKLKDLGLETLPDGALKNILAHNFPIVCKAYNEESCKDGICHNLHLCDKFVQYSCPFEKSACQFSHDVTSGHNTRLLKMFGFAAKSAEELIICNTLLPKGKRLTADQQGFSRRTFLSNENLNDLSGEKPDPMSGRIGGLHIGGPTEGKNKRQKQKGQKQQNVMRSDGGKIGEASLKLNIAEGVDSKASHFSVASMDGSSGRGGGSRGGGSRGRGGARGARGGGIGRGRGKGRGGRSNVADMQDSVQDIQQRWGFDRHLAELMMGNQQLRKIQVEAGETATSTTEEKGEASVKKKWGKRHKAKKDKGDLSQTSEETFEEEANLIDLSQEPQSPMPHVDWSIDDILSMDHVDQLSSPIAQSDDLDDWLTSLSGPPLLSQESTGSDLLEAELSPGTTAVGGLNERVIVHSICKEYNGTVAFPVLAKREDLFPCTTQDSEKWLRARPRKFLLSENENGEIEEVTVIMLGARICFLYQMKLGKCSKAKCYFLHLCKEYVETGCCVHGKSCRLSHDFHDKHNHQIVKKLRLADFTVNQLRNLVISSGPQVCIDYNEFSCDKGSRCNKVHICKAFVEKKCISKEDCDFAHDLGLSTSHTKHVLAKFQLESLPPKAVLRMLMVCDKAELPMDAGQEKLQMTGEFLTRT